MERYHVSVLVRLMILAVFILSSLVLISTYAGRADAASETITGGSDVVGAVSADIPIDDIVISGTGNSDIPVRLHVSSGTMKMSTTSGLSFTGPSTGATLEFHGLRNDINNALATLSYKRNSIGTDTLEISLTNPGEVVYEGNGHMYEVIHSPGISALSARSQATTLTRYGSTGYLVTITSAEENSYVTSRLGQAGWMGASDEAVEGEWKWATGPESGTLFWTGGIPTGGGHTVSGQYSNWGNNEPNNSGNNEDCGQILSGGTGKWNDLNCLGALDYYVVEFGAPGDMPQIQTSSLEITTAQIPSKPSAPTATAGIESAQVSFNTPNANGSAITQYRVTASPGGLTATGATSPITITGLTGGVEYTFTVLATNGIGDSDGSNPSNTIIPMVSPTWSDDLLGIPRVDVPYSDAVKAGGYPLEMQYTIINGSLPIGLSLDTDTGTITGTPKQAGEYSFTIKASNGIGSPITKSFSGTVASAPAIDLRLEFEMNSNINNDLSIIVSGAGLKPGSEYRVVVESTPRQIGAGYVSSLGTFASRVYLPRDLEPGSHSITVYGTSVTEKAMSATAYFRVNNSGKILAISYSGSIGDDLALIGGILPMTGSSVTNLMLFAWSLIFAGLFIFMNRRFLSGMKN